LEVKRGVGVKLDAVICDLDETIIDTRMLKKFRDCRDWNSCYQHLKLCNIYPGIDSFLKYLDIQSIPLGIVTMSPKSYALKLLVQHGVQYLNLVAFHDCFPRKPDPAPMLKCAEMLRVNPRNVLAIGDEPKDIEAANRAEMISVGVTWGASRKQDLAAVNPNYICTSSTELIDLVKSLDSNCG
jgi:HAD superfamily hydrolase (TIGR01509 family)